MKTLLFIIARNVQHRAKRMTEVYLRRAVLNQRVKPFGSRRHSFYGPQFRASRSYFKHRR